MSIGNGGIIGKLNTTTNLVASGIFTIREQEKLQKTDVWPQVISVSVAPNITVVNEGENVTFNVVAGGIPNGTTLYWTTNTVSGTINTSDFASGTTSGSFTVSNGVAQITRTMAVDGTSETNDSFSLSIRSGSISGPILATSEAVTINPLVFTIQTSVNPVNEGSNITFDVSYVGVNDGYPIHYEVINAGGTVNASDFTTGITGSFVTDSVNKNVTLTVRSDQLTEGTESFFLRLRFGSLSGAILAVSETVNITDLSVNPTITFDTITTSLNEGVTNNITISASPAYSSPLTLTWSITVLSGTLNFSATTGTLSNFTNTASFSVTALTSGSGGTYRINILNGSITVATSATVTVSNVVNITTMTFVASATSNTTTITIPATAQAGDMAIIFDTPINSTTAATTLVPTGFTLIKNDFIQPGDATNLRSIVSYRILTTGQAGTGVTVMNASGPRSLILVFRPNNPISTVTVSTPIGEGTTANPVVQTISMAGQQTPLIGFGVYRSSGAVSPRTSSLTMTEVQGVNTGVFVKYIIYNSGSTPQDGTVDMDDEGTNILQSFYIRFA